MQIRLSATETGAFFCNECDSKFAEDEALKQHMLQVHSDKPYKCDRCQAAFRYKGNLASHKTVHTGTSRGSARCPSGLFFVILLQRNFFTFPCPLCFQERSPIAVTSVVLSLTDQLTSRLTPASTQERSHTNVRRVELDLYR